MTYYIEALLIIIVYDPVGQTMILVLCYYYSHWSPDEQTDITPLLMTVELFYYYSCQFNAQAKTFWQALALFLLQALAIDISLFNAKYQYGYSYSLVLNIPDMTNQQYCQPSKWQ